MLSDARVLYSRSRVYIIDGSSLSVVHSKGAISRLLASTPGMDYMVATAMTGIGRTEDGIPYSRQAHTRSAVGLVLSVAMLVSRYCRHCRPNQYVAVVACKDYPVMWQVMRVVALLKW